MMPLHELAAQAASGFAASFGCAPQAMAAAPGRVNLIGEHTDYCQGFVLPAAIPLYTVVALGTGTGGQTRAVSSRFGQVTLPADCEGRNQGFRGYLAGALLKAGFSGRPVDVYVHGNLPVQAGLSSSASLLVALLAGLAQLDNQPWQPLDIALAAQEVENEYVGVPCGFMDQFAVACGRKHRALLLDCLDNSHVEVDARLPGHDWLVVYSGLRRKLASGGYREKVKQLKLAVQRLESDGWLKPGFAREEPPEIVAMACGRSGLTRQAAFLVRHLVDENRRVHAMRYALAKGEVAVVRGLLYSGHRSLSKLFGVSLPQLDALVAFADRRPGVLGMRLTGAGMGGSLVALVESATADESALAIEAFVRKKIHRDGTVYRIPSFADGVCAWKP